MDCFRSFSFDRFFCQSKYDYVFRNVNIFFLLSIWADLCSFSGSPICFLQFWPIFIFQWVFSYLVDFDLSNLVRFFHIWADFFLSLLSKLFFNPLILSVFDLFLSSRDAKKLTLKTLDISSSNLNDSCLHQGTVFLDYKKKNHYFLLNWWFDIEKIFYNLQFKKMLELVAHIHISQWRIIWKFP